MPDMPKNITNIRAFRGRAIAAVFAALSLTGCGGYFSDEWPNLAEGFADAAERDAALGDTVGEPESGAQPVASADLIPEEAAPAVAVATPAPAPQPTINLTPEEMLQLALDFEVAADKIEAGRQAYLAARAAITVGSNVGAKGRWLTAQLELTGLNRAGAGLDPILAKLPVAEVCAAGEGGDAGQIGETGEACALARRARDTSANLAAYLVEERRHLLDQEPAGPS